MAVALASLSGLEVVLEVRISLDRSEPRQRSTPKIRMKNDTSSVDHTLQRTGLQILELAQDLNRDARKIHSLASLHPFGGMVDRAPCLDRQQLPWAACIQPLHHFVDRR